jgi:adenylylsulfate kinase
MSSNQEGLVVWLTGLSASGKTTVARALAAMLMSGGRACRILDGDEVRATICRDLGFSDADRAENVRRVAALAGREADAGTVCIVALISPLRSQRAEARRIVGDGRFVEVHVSATLEACERRDPKGLYRRARSGEIPEFTGISSSYEPPNQPDVTLDSELRSSDENARQLYEYLKRMK